MIIRVLEQSRLCRILQIKESVVQTAQTQSCGMTINETLDPRLSQELSKVEKKTK